MKLDHLELQVVQVFLDFQGRKGHQEKREKKEMLDCLVFQVQLALEETEAVLELLDFQVKKDKKENLLL